MPSIELRNVNNFILRDINLRIHDGELVVLLGPEGAGKSTVLNIIAGLVDYSGRILIDGRPVNGTKDRRMRIAYLFQDLFLFPHLTVTKNIAYGPESLGESAVRVREKTERLLDMLRIRHIAHRYPGNLSGGEKQKVALARALAIDPQLLLLDEPMKNLNHKTERYLRKEIRQLKDDLEMTSLYVTHNRAEAAQMADCIVMLAEGRIVRVGTPSEVLAPSISRLEG